MHQCISMGNPSLTLTSQCIGFSTLLLNLGLPDLAEPDQVIETKGNCSDWLREYVQGCGLEVYGFSPCPSFYNSTFKQVSLFVFPNCIYVYMCL